MQLTTIDWCIICGYFVLVIGIGLLFRGRAGKSLSEYFVSGRSLPWWIAGTSMVATTFAADTPLAVVGLVAKDGLAGNWFWWAFAMGGMVTVFVYAKLWRRAEVMTDVEFINIRYGGAPGRLLRYTRAIYVALIVNPIIIGWVVGAMLTVLEQTVLYDVATKTPGSGANSWLVIAAMLVVVGFYCTLSGMWGVAVTDVIQFCLAMFGCVWLAVVAWNHIGGAEALQQRVAANFGDGEQAFSFLPQFSADEPWMPLHIFLIMLAVQWWATWYPGAEPGGGGYVVQRMASCKDERHSILATLWYQVAHYCVRPWPWLIVAFAALAMYPGLREIDDPGQGFPMVMRDLGRPGLNGLLLVTFFAAFMSTISTQMNWGASYLVRDFFQPVFAKDATDQQLTRYSRYASILVLVIGGIAAMLMKLAGLSVDQAWKLLAAIGAGTGAVFMLRWFWWRINAWTEIVAMISSLAYYLGFTFYQAKFNSPFREEETMAMIAGLTIFTWLLVTLFTRPEDGEILRAFYRKIRPGGPGWKPIASGEPSFAPDGDLPIRIVGALLGIGLIYSVLPGTGFILFGQTSNALICGLLAMMFASGVWIVVSRLFESS